MDFQGSREVTFWTFCIFSCIFLYFLTGMASSRMGCNLNIVVACGCHVNFVLAGRLFVALGKRLLLRLGMPLVTLWLLYATSVS